MIVRFHKHEIDPAARMLRPPWNTVAKVFLVGLVISIVSNWLGQPLGNPWLVKDMAGLLILVYVALTIWKWRRARRAKVDTVDEASSLHNQILMKVK
jgi:hypothetical protein